MLKEFIEHIQKTAQPTIRVEEGRTYIRPRWDRAE